MISDEICGRVKPAGTNLRESGFYRDVWEWEASVPSGARERVVPFDFGGAAEYKAPNTLNRKFTRTCNPILFTPESDMWHVFRAGVYGDDLGRS